MGVQELKSNITKHNVEFFRECLFPQWKIRAIGGDVLINTTPNTKTTLTPTSSLPVIDLEAFELKAILTAFAYKDLHYDLFELILTTVEDQQKRQGKAMRRLAKIGVPVQDEVQEPKPIEENHSNLGKDWVRYKLMSEVIEKLAASSTNAAIPLKDATIIYEAHAEPRCLS